MVEFPGPRIGPLSLKTKKVAQLSGALLVFAGSITDAAAAPIPTVRVLVDRERSGAELAGFDLVVTDAVTGQELVRAEGRASLDFRCGLDGRLSGEAITGARGPADGAKRPLAPMTGPLKITSQGGFLRVDDKRLREEVYLYSKAGECMIVNHVDLEKYVAGLLNSEMNASWNMETLKAQAVAARTYAIYQMRETTRGFDQAFDLDSSVKDQVYEGAHQERYRALRAVEQTRGEILAFNGKPIKAFYHSTCGGRTASADKVWGFRSPYLIPVACGFCNVSPRYRWEHKTQMSDLEVALKMKGIIQGKLAGVRVGKRTTLGRVETVEVFDGLRMVTVGGARFREIAGFSQLRSTDFTVMREGGVLRFRGTGSGHGVGMCQWGSKAMGEKGFAYKQILSKYYPLAKLNRIY
jgi:stage II sporulation protein D